jgi:hypothetical protein
MEQKENILQALEKLKEQRKEKNHRKKDVANPMMNLIKPEVRVLFRFFITFLINHDLFSSFPT